MDMVAEQSEGFVETPKVRRNAFLWIYDRPLYRDWVFWLTVGWVVITLPSLAFGKNSSRDLPRWENVLLGTIFIPLLFGALPAGIRRGVRGWRSSRVRGDAAPHAVLGHVPAAPNPRISNREDWPAPSAGITDDIRANQSALAGPPPTEPPTHQESADPSTPSNVVAFRPNEDARDVLADPVDLAAGGQSIRYSSLELARTALPYPIARAARAIQRAANAREEYEEVLAAGEAIAITLGACIAACFHEEMVDQPQFEELRGAFSARGVSEGHWIALIASTFAFLKDRPEILPGLNDALRPGKGGAGISSDLRLLLEERNRWAHGARPRNDVEAEHLLDSLAPALDRTFAKIIFLENSPWYLAEGSSYRRRAGVFNVSATLAMGDHPEFRRVEFESNVPLADDTFYLVAAGTSFDLTPLVVNRYCEICKQAEILYADRLDPRDGLALKSFARGHVVFDQNLNDDLELLFSPNQRPPSVGS
jgi:hypothetical protein